MNDNDRVNRVEWLTVNASDPDPGAIRRAAEAIGSGGVVIYPTDTLYGLAADPRQAFAVERIFAVKGRPGGQPLPLVVSGLGQARAVAALGRSALRLAERFWPGPLTLVADARPGLAAGVAGADGSVALRVPDHRVARDLADAVGFAITSTSANPSGGEAPRHAHDAAAGVPEADLILDGGPTAGGPPSTIVDARTDPPRLVRDGAVAFRLVLETLTRP
jgi:L-threonylcarbamoyladenylate synthase